MIRTFCTVICDAIAAVLLVWIILAVTEPLAVEAEMRDCRVSFRSVTEYPALVDVCKDVKARRAIIAWDAINKIEASE